LALDATVDARSRAGARRLAAGELVVGPYMTALAHDELLVSVRIPIRRGRSGWAIEEIARRPGDFALVGGAATLVLGDDDAIADARVVLFGVGARAIRLPAVEAELTGLSDLPGTLGDVCRRAAAELTPPTDAQASGEYRKRVAAPLVARLLTDALD